MLSGLVLVAKEFDELGGSESLDLSNRFDRYDPKPDAKIRGDQMHRPKPSDGTIVMYAEFGIDEDEVELHECEDQLNYWA